MNAAQMFFYEKLALILNAETMAERCQRAKDIAKGDTTFLPLLRIALQDEHRILGVPEGVPTTYKPDRDLPIGFAGTTLRQELRRLRNFQPGGSATNVKPIKREAMWIQILESIHHKEATSLTQLKDRTLLIEYPGLEEVLVALGMQIAESVQRKREVVQVDSKSDPIVEVAASPVVSEPVVEKSKRVKKT